MTYMNCEMSRALPVLPLFFCALFFFVFGREDSLSVNGVRYTS